MKKEIKKTGFTKLSDSEMKCILGGETVRKIEILVNGLIIIIYV